MEMKRAKVCWDVSFVHALYSFSEGCVSCPVCNGTSARRHVALDWTNHRGAQWFQVPLQKHPQRKKRRCCCIVDIVKNRKKVSGTLTLSWTFSNDRNIQRKGWQMARKWRPVVRFTKQYIPVPGVLSRISAIEMVHIAILYFNLKFYFYFRCNSNNASNKTIVCNTYCNTELRRNNMPIMTCSPNTYSKTKQFFTSISISGYYCNNIAIMLRAKEMSLLLNVSC